MLRFAVFGGGAGGHATAGELALAGFNVKMFELPQFRENITPILERGGIMVTGVGRTGLARPSVVTTDPAEAVEDVDMVMFTVPAFGHKAFFEACLPHLKSGQTIVFNTGYFACLRFRRALVDAGKKDVVLAETAQLVYAANLKSPGSVEVRNVKRVLPVAALPSKYTGEVAVKLRAIYPQCIPEQSVLKTSLETVNPMTHPAVGLLSIGLIDRLKEDFYFYRDGVTPSVAKVLDTLDAERMAIGRALGYELVSHHEWINKYYGSKGASYYESIHAVESHTSWPWSRECILRYLKEDVPYGLVPLASLGDALNVPTPVTKAVVTLASVISGVDYWREGTTVEKLGLSGLSPKQMVEQAT